MTFVVGAVAIMREWPFLSPRAILAGVFWYSTSYRELLVSITEL